MKITFIRHSKVDFNWRTFYDSESFDLACRDYDDAPVLVSGSKALSQKRTYISGLKRAEETAHGFLTGEKELIKTALLDEIPLQSFTTTKVKLPTLIWMIAGRLQWYFNSSRQAESRKRSKVRINQFLDLLEEAQMDCTIIGHGFYFTQMTGEMKKRGIIGATKKKLHNEECRIFISNRLPHAGKGQSLQSQG